jgi:hypothetical protein
MSFKSILQYFIVEHGVKPGAPATRSTSASALLDALMSECELPEDHTDITDKISVSMIEECLKEMKTRALPLTLTLGQTTKLLNVIKLINAGAPASSTTSEWVTAYNSHHQVGELDDELSHGKLNKPVEMLNNFTWIEGTPMEQLLHFITSINAWGLSQYPGAARLLSIKRAADNTIIEEKPTTKIDTHIKLAAVFVLSL